MLWSGCMLPDISGDSDDLEPQEPKKKEPEIKIMDQSSYPPLIVEEKTGFLEKSVAQKQNDVKNFADEVVTSNLMGFKSIERSPSKERKSNDQTQADMKIIIKSLQESIAKLNMDFKRR